MPGNTSIQSRLHLSSTRSLELCRKSIQVLREVKSNPDLVLTTFIEDSRNYIGLKNEDIVNIKLTELPIADRYSTGSQISKKPITDAFLVPTLTRAEKHQDTLIAEEPKIIKVLEEEKPSSKKEKISLQEIDDRLMTIDDFLEEKED